MSTDTVYAQLERIARDNGLKLTDNAYNIAKFRARIDLPMSQCPCAQGDKERFCISEQCMKDIEKYGICHCRCFTKGE